MNREFTIFNSTWSIKFEDKVYLEGRYTLGSCDSSTRTISISTKLEDGSKVPKKEIELTTIHELMHAILATGQYMEETDNEPLVECLARCIHSLLVQKIIK